MKQPTLTTLNNFQTVDDARNWFSDLVTEYGIGWHPEDLFDTENTPDAELLNHKMLMAFEICNAADVDICEVAMEASREYRWSFGLGVDEKILLEN